MSTTSKVRLWLKARPMFAQSALTAILVVGLGTAVFAVVGDSGESDGRSSDRSIVSAPGATSSTTDQAGSSGSESVSTSTSSSAPTGTSGNSQQPDAPANAPVTTITQSATPASTAPAATQDDRCGEGSPAIAVREGLGATILSDIGAQFTLSLKKEYVGIGINGTAKRNSTTWNAETTLTGLPIYNNMAVEFVITSDAVFVNAPPLMSMMTGGYDWGRINASEIPGVNSTAAFDRLAPSPVDAGDEIINGVATCKLIQSGVRPEDLLAILPGFVNDIITGLSTDISAVPPADLTFFIAPDRTVRRIVGVVGGSQVFFADVTSWGESPVVNGPPPEDETGTFTLD